jgi:hypothetical protein
MPSRRADSTGTTSAGVVGDTCAWAAPITSDASSETTYGTHLTSVAFSLIPPIVPGRNPTSTTRIQKLDSERVGNRTHAGGIGVKRCSRKSGVFL